MVTGSTAGHLAIWNLEERRLQAQMRDVHAGAVAAVSFLTSEPILVTNGGDNTLKVGFLSLWHTVMLERTVLLSYCSSNINFSLTTFKGHL